MYKGEIESLKQELSFTYGEQILSYDSGYICDIFSEIASNNIDIYYSDIFDWAKNNTWYIDESMKEYGNCNDIVRQIQMAQGYAYEQELYENEDSILKLFAYNYLEENEIKLDEEQLYDLESELESYYTNNRLENIVDIINEIDGNKGFDIA